MEKDEIKSSIRRSMCDLRYSLYRIGLNDTSAESIMECVESISIQSSVLGLLETRREIR